MTIKHDDWVQRVRARELRLIPIPNEHRGKTLADVAVHRGNAAAIEVVEAWLKNAGQYLSTTSPTAGRGLLLFGPPGTGKTLLASVVANSVVRRAKVPDTVHFTSMEGFNRHRLRKMELTRMLDSGRFDDDGLADQLLFHDEAVERCYDARLLVLDDVGQENMTEHLSRMLNELLRDRYGRGCPTIITTNVDPYDWDTQFGNPSLASFVFQACLVASVAGKDARVAG